MLHAKMVSTCFNGILWPGSTLRSVEPVQHSILADVKKLFHHVKMALLRRTGQCRCGVTGLVSQRAGETEKDWKRIGKKASLLLPACNVTSARANNNR